MARARLDLVEDSWQGILESFRDSSTDDYARAWRNAFLSSLGRNVRANVCTVRDGEVLNRYR